MIRPIAAFVAGAFALALWAASAAAQTFTYTAIPDQDETRLNERFAKVTSYLQTTLGVPVRYAPVKSYPAAVTAFQNNQVQLAWFGGLTGVQARLRVPGSEAIAQGYEDQFFVTYFIAHKSTALKPSDDFPKAIAGKSFTFGAKGSTSGRLMPEFHIARVFGKPPENVFSRVGFSGDHSKTAALVASGAYEVGALDFTVFETEVKQGRIRSDDVVVLWKTPPYPDYQWTIRGEVDRSFGAGFKDKVRKALLEMNDPDLLASFPRKSFVPAKNDDYTSILETATKIGLID